MNEPNISHQNIGAALDAVKLRHTRGELIGDQSISLASLLRQRLPELGDLHKEHSASAIATALTQEGFKVSASTVQRVLREGEPVTKQKKRAVTTTDAGKTKATVLASVASGSGVPPQAGAQAKETTDAEALLKKMQEENGGSHTGIEAKRIVSLKK